jgi:glutamate:GABA antiporter
VTWLIGSDRAQAVAGYDGAAPRAFGYFSKRLGTPIVVNLVSGVVSTIVLVLALTLTSGNAAKYFSATLGVVISMVTITYVLIFPAVIKLRYSRPDVPRPYRIPGGKVGLWTAGILTTAWALFTTVAIIFPGIGTAHPDASLPSGFAGQRLEYTLSQLIPLVVMVLIGLLFYALGAPTRRQVAQADAVSGQAGSGEAVPSEAVPSEAVPSEAVPGKAPSGEAVPGEAVPGEAVPGKAPSGETASGETASGDGTATKMAQE